MFSSTSEAVASSSSLSTKPVVLRLNKQFSISVSSCQRPRILRTYLFAETTLPLALKVGFPTTLLLFFFSLLLLAGGPEELAVPELLGLCLSPAFVITSSLDEVEDLPSLPDFGRTSLSSLSSSSPLSMKPVFVSLQDPLSSKNVQPEERSQTYF